GNVLAFCGRGSEAIRVAVELEAKHPHHTFVKSLYVPTIHGVVAIFSEGDAAKGIDLLRATARYELARDDAAPLLFRVIAYLRQKDAVRAAIEFDKIRAHPDTFKRLPTYAVATLGDARAAALGGNFDRSRQLYEEFLQLW